VLAYYGYWSTKLANLPGCQEILLVPKNTRLIALKSDSVGFVARQVQCCRAGSVFIVRQEGWSGKLILTLQFLCLALLLVWVWYSSLFVTSFLLLVLCWTFLTGQFCLLVKELYSTRYQSLSSVRELSLLWAEPSPPWEEGGDGSSNALRWWGGWWKCLGEKERVSYIRNYKRTIQMPNNQITVKPLITL
jgi:hypothetical protein